MSRFQQRIMVNVGRSPTDDNPSGPLAHGLSRATSFLNVRVKTLRPCAPNGVPEGPVLGAAKAASVRYSFHQCIAD